MVEIIKAAKGNGGDWFVVELTLVKGYA